MSLRPRALPEVPAQTVAVARAAFPRGALAMRVRDELGEVFAGLYVGVRPAGSDIVVVRDDSWGTGGWTSLTDVDDGLLMNLGRVDQVDVEGLRRLAASINKHFGDGGGAGRRRRGRRGRRSGRRWRCSTPARSGRSGCWTGCGSGCRWARRCGGHRRAAVHHQYGAGAVRAGRQPGGRADEQAVRRRVGQRGRGDPGTVHDGR